MRPRGHFRGGPPWWPAGEPWPPQGRFGAAHRSRARFFRRIVIAAFMLVVLAVAGILSAAWILAGRLGLSGWTAPIPALVALAAAILLFASMLGAMRRFTFPLRAVMDAADRVAGGDYAVRVEEDGPPPMRALAHAFNAMTTRLQHADRLRRSLMADVAHELRTPLSVLQGRLEGLMDGVYPRDEQQIGELLEETRVLSRLIDDLRTLALSDAGALPLQKEPTDLVALIRDTIRSLASEADRQGVTLEIDVDSETVSVDLDPLRIREVLTNLLTNALRHGRVEGRSVSLTMSVTTSEIEVAVTDSGEGIAPEDAERIFDRFYKGVASQGSGLGLAIAKGIVTAHGGEIKAASRPGAGTTMVFTLPRT
jgi:signal transduction histidine kinase